MRLVHRHGAPDIPEASAAGREKRTRVHVSLGDAGSRPRMSYRRLRQRRDGSRRDIRPPGRTTMGSRRDARNCRIDHPGTVIVATAGTGLYEQFSSTAAMPCAPTSRSRSAAAMPARSLRAPADGARRLHLDDGEHVRQPQEMAGRPGDRAAAPRARPCRRLRQLRRPEIEDRPHLAEPGVHRRIGRDPARAAPRYLQAVSGPPHAVEQIGHPHRASFRLDRKARAYVAAPHPRPHPKIGSVRTE